MRCVKHGKDLVGPCTWCGAQLCSVCISKKEGIKLFCDKCRGVVSSIRRDRVVRDAPSSGRRYVMENGYLVTRDK